MVFHRSLNNSQSPQVSRTLLSILVASSNAASWMVLILSLISSSWSLFFRFLRTIAKARITIGITVTFMHHCVFCSFFRYLFSFLPSFTFILCSVSTAKSTIQVLFFLLIKTRFGLLIWIERCVCSSKSLKFYDYYHHFLDSNIKFTDSYVFTSVKI